MSQRELIPPLGKWPTPNVVYVLFLSKHQFCKNLKRSIFVGGWQQQANMLLLLLC